MVRDVVRDRAVPDARGCHLHAPHPSVEESGMAGVHWHDSVCDAGVDRAQHRLRCDRQPRAGRPPGDPANDPVWPGAFVRVVCDRRSAALRGVRHLPAPADHGRGVFQSGTPHRTAGAVMSEPGRAHVQASHTGAARPMVPSGSDRSHRGAGAARTRLQNCEHDSRRGSRPHARSRSGGRCSLSCRAHGGRARRPTGVTRP